MLFHLLVLLSSKSNNNNEGAVTSKKENGFIVMIKKVWAKIIGIFSIVRAEQVEELNALRYENVGLRVQLLQLHQKNAILSNKFEGVDQEGFLVVQQMEKMMSDLQERNAQLESAMQVMLGSCQCGKRYNAQALEILEYQLHKCNNALDECLTGVKSTETFDFIGVESDVIIEKEEEDIEVLEVDASKVKITRNADGSIQDKEEEDIFVSSSKETEMSEMCAFHTAVADKCIDELGADHADCLAVLKYIKV